jgi:hypothetical protein
MLDFSKNYDTSDFSPVEENWYEMSVVGAEFKNSKAGDRYLSIQFKISDNNRRIFSIFNIFNKNDKARNISLSRMQSLLKAQGFDLSKLDKVDDVKLVTLLSASIEFDGYVVIKEAQNGFSASNDVIKFKQIEQALTLDKKDVPF